MFTCIKNPYTTLLFQCWMVLPFLTVGSFNSPPFRVFETVWSSWRPASTQPYSCCKSENRMSIHLGTNSLLFDFTTSSDSFQITPMCCQKQHVTNKGVPIFSSDWACLFPTNVQEGTLNKIYQWINGIATYHKGSVMEHTLSWGTQYHSLLSIPWQWFISACFVSSTRCANEHIKWAT